MPQDIRRKILIVLTTVLSLMFVGLRLVTVAVDETYSPGWYSQSSAEAEQRGVLLNRPAVVLNSRLEALGLEKADIWVEQVIHVEYPAYALWMWRREVRDNRWRIVILVPPSLRTPEYSCIKYLRFGDRSFGVSSGQSAGDYHTLVIDSLPPKTLRLSTTLWTRCESGSPVERMSNRSMQQP